MEISCTNENELYKISAPDKTKTKTKNITWKVWMLKKHVD